MSKTILTQHAVSEHFRLAKAACCIFSVSFVYYFLRVNIFESYHPFYLSSRLVTEGIGELALLRGLIYFGF